MKIFSALIGVISATIITWPQPYPDPMAITVYPREDDRSTQEIEAVPAVSQPAPTYQEPSISPVPPESIQPEYRESAAVPEPSPWVIPVAEPTEPDNYSHSEEVNICAGKNKDWVC